MNDGDPLDPASHVTKLVKGSKVHDGVRVDGVEFIPRPTDEYMSVNWLEYEGDSNLDTCLKKIMNNYLYEKGMNVKNTNWLPVINVKKAIEYVKARSSDRILKFLYKPELKPEYPYDDPSHSGVYGYSPIDHENAMIGDLLSDVVGSLRKAKDFK